MAGLEETVAAVAAAPSWDARVGLIRRVPENFGTAQHQAIYAAIAQQVYVPNLAPDFAYIHWSDDYELAPLMAAYERAETLTKGFTLVSPDELTAVIAAEPRSLRIFRLLLGFTSQEFAAATTLVAEEIGATPVSHGAVRTMEAGGAATPAAARCCAEVVHRGIAGELFPAPTGELRSKLDKPDTAAGWESVRRYAREGVPLPVLLHQRHYGGAFRQLLDATSSRRGDVLEEAVQQLFLDAGVPFIRTGSHDQAEIEQRFQITVKPAPDFVVYESGTGALEGLLECKAANDGGTARDKAARFRSLRAEANRLGGVPLFAVLGGLGWKRTGDALGPVVRDTDGRTFPAALLAEMLTVQPFPRLLGTAP